jgi:hypothetical protein
MRGFEYIPSAVIGESAAIATQGHDSGLHTGCIPGSVYVLSMPPLSRFSLQAAAPAPLLPRSGVVVFSARFDKTDSGFEEQYKKRIGGWRLPKTTCALRLATSSVRQAGGTSDG